jgi:hypothetical protein
MAASLPGKVASRQSPHCHPRLLPIVLASFATWRLSLQEEWRPILIALRVEEAWANRRTKDERVEILETRKRANCFHVTNLDRVDSMNFTHKKGDYIFWHIVAAFGEWSAS